MLHVFIDTNVLLTFFSFAEDELEELRKLRTAINNGELKLWMTDQVRHELRRNREAKVAHSMDALKKLKPGGGIPQMARNLPEFEDFLTARREFDRRLNELREELSQQFDNGTLAADRVLGELLESTDIVEVTDEIVDAARRRVDIGNPPGKKGSLGDAINWECLLRLCLVGEDLYLVIAALSSYSEFTNQQAREMLEGACWNTQISWIAHDADVREFFQRLLDEHEDSFEANEFAHFNEVFHEDEEDED